MSQAVKQQSRMRLESKTLLQWSWSGLSEKTSSKVLGLGLGLGFRGLDTPGGLTALGMLERGASHVLVGGRTFELSGRVIAGLQVRSRKIMEA